MSTTTWDRRDDGRPAQPCRGCGQHYDRRNANQRYCLTCKPRPVTEITRDCPHCGTSFVAHRRDKRYCSQVCAKRASSCRQVARLTAERRAASGKRYQPHQKPAVLPPEYPAPVRKRRKRDEEDGNHFTDEAFRGELERIRQHLLDTGQPLTVPRTADGGFDLAAFRSTQRIDALVESEPGECDTCGTHYRWPVRREGGRFCSLACAGGEA